MRFPVNSLTSALFYSNVRIDNGIAFASDLIRLTGSALDYEPMVLPIQQPVPPDQPRIVLRSRDKMFVCEISLNRVYFHYHGNPNQPEALERMFPRYREAFYRILTALYEMVNLPPHRLGFVARILKPTCDAASALLQDEFLSDDRFADALETHLHFLHGIHLVDIPCNRWVRFRTVRPPGSMAQSHHALLEIDINTRVETPQQFASNQVVSFYLEAYEHVRTQAEKYLSFANDES